MPYERPVITADIIVICNDEILLIERAHEPYANMLALPGGHFDVASDASVVECAARELREETGLNVPLNKLKFFNYYDKPNRDPRGRYVSFVFACIVPPEEREKAVAGDDAKKCLWVPASSLKHCLFAFDHEEILLQRFTNWSFVK